MIDKVTVYYVQSGENEKLESLPGARADMTVSYEEKWENALIIGGINNKKIATKECLTFNIKDLRLSFFANLIDGRKFPGVLQTECLVFVFGGLNYDGRKAVKTIERK